MVENKNIKEETVAMECAAAASLPSRDSFLREAVDSENKHRQIITLAFGIFLLIGAALAIGIAIPVMGSSLYGPADEIKRTMLSLLWAAIVAVVAIVAWKIFGKVYGESSDFVYLLLKKMGAENDKSLPVNEDTYSKIESGYYSFSDKWRAFLRKIKFDKWKGWFYLSPAIVLLMIFTVWPIFNTVRMSLLEGYTTMKDVAGVTFNIGLGNFTRVLEYPGFINCLKNTLLLCVLTVPISTFLALLIAVCLNAIKPLQRFLQTIFFLPYVTNSIAIGMVFAAMFNMIIGGNVRPDSVGIVNNVIEFFGGTYINWMNAGSEYWANIFVMVVYIVWNALPFKILILLGGLQSVNKQYYEAAKVDGTPKWRVFTRITVPLLSPMLAYVIITGFIGGFKEYSSIVGIFGESMGPVGNQYSLDTMVGFIYRAIGNQEGTASAAALILFAIIFVVTMINLYVSKKKTHY